jgi:hypothetical protein
MDSVSFECFSFFDHDPLRVSVQSLILSVSVMPSAVIPLIQIKSHQSIFNVFNFLVTRKIWQIFVEPYEVGYNDCYILYLLHFSHFLSL